MRLFVAPQATGFSFQKTTYEENLWRLEVQPILEKRFEKLQIDFNPVFERALRDPGTLRGRNFEPAARATYELAEQFMPSLEYYSSWGPLPSFSPMREQIHQILPGGDVKLAKSLVWSFGIPYGQNIRTK